MMYADELDQILTREFVNQEAAIDAIEALILGAWKEVSPVVEVLKKHYIPFKNSRVEHETACGLLVGEAKEGAGPRLAVLDGERVYYVEAGGDKLDMEESEPLKKFIREADLAAVKAGFAFVRNVKSSVVEKQEAYTQRLRAFLRDNQTL